MFWKGTETDRKTLDEEKSAMVPWMDTKNFPNHYLEQTSRKYPKRRRHHIPHAKRPTDFVKKRNQRERKRVGKVNAAFGDLRDRVPFIKDDDKTSKLAVLRSAAQYIQFLYSLLVDNESSSVKDVCSRMSSLSKQNDAMEPEQCWSTEDIDQDENLFKMSVVTSCRFEHHHDHSNDTTQSSLLESRRSAYDSVAGHFTINQTLF